MDQYVLDLFLDCLAGGFLGGSITCCAFVYYFKSLNYQYQKAKHDVDFLIEINRLKRDVEELKNAKKEY